MYTLKSKSFVSVVKNIFANSFGVLVNVLSQIFLVPFYLKYWGVEKYGDWIVITSISMFFSMTDLGFNTITSNLFAIQHVDNERGKCNSLLVNNFILLLFALILCLFFVIPTVFYFDITNLLSINVFGRSETSVVFVLLIVYVFLGLFSTVLNAIYRASYKASYAYLLDNLTRFFEFIVLLIGIICNINVVIIVLFYLVPKFFLITYKFLNSKKYFNYSISLKYVDWCLLKQTLTQSLTFSCLPISQAISLQGLPLIVNAFIGPSVLVLFNTTRTLVNFIKIALGVIANSIWSEFSLAFAEKKYNEMKIMHRFSFYVTFAISMLIFVVIMIIGDYIYSFWTCKTIAFDKSLTISLMLIGVVNALWNMSSVCILSTNNHSTFAVRYLIMTIFYLVLFYLMLEHGFTIYSTLYISLIVEFYFLGYVVNKSLFITKDSVREFVRWPFSFISIN